MGSREGLNRDNGRRLKGQRNDTIGVTTNIESADWTPVTIRCYVDHFHEQLFLTRSHGR